MRRNLFPLLLVLLLPGGAGKLAGQAALENRLMSKGSTEVPLAFGHGRLGVWSGGTLLVVQDRFTSAPVFRVFARDGREISQFTFVIPGASRINIYDNAVARGSDGSLAVIGSTYTNDSRGGTFLAWISPDGRDQTVVRLSPFSPHAVTLASDGAIWVAGYDTKQDPAQRDHEQHLIRRYDREGKLLGSFVPWSKVRTPPRTLPATMRSMLISSPDRIGWYSPSSQTYVEFSLDGTLINWIRTPEHPSDVMLNATLCDDGSLFVSAALLGRGSQRAPSWGIFTLDRQRGEWSFIPQREGWGKLYGCDGTRLATTTDSRTITWLEPAEK